MIFLWVILYGVIYTLAERVSQAMHMTQSITAFAMLMYILLFILWIYKTGQRRKIGLNIIHPFGFRECWTLCPLIVFPLYNFWVGRECLISLPTMIIVLSLSVSEELFFRGFMLHFFVRWGNLSSILITSTIFALFHFVNIIKDNNVVYILIQVLCAFFVGICYIAVTIKYNSLLPCVVIHFLTNITGINTYVQNRNIGEMSGVYLCMMVHAIYGVYLFKKCNNY